MRPFGVCVPLPDSHRTSSPRVARKINQVKEQTKEKTKERLPNLICTTSRVARRGWAFLSDRVVTVRACSR
jgi:hypothetical protein